MSSAAQTTGADPGVVRARRAGARRGRPARCGSCRRSRRATRAASGPAHRRARAPGAARRRAGPTRRARTTSFAARSMRRSGCSSGADLTALEALYLERARELSLEAAMCAAAGTLEVAAPRPRTLRTARRRRSRARRRRSAPRGSPSRSPGAAEATIASDDPDPASLLSRMQRGRRAPAPSFRVVAQPVARAARGHRRARHPGRHGTSGAGGGRAPHGAPRDRGPRAAARAVGARRRRSHFRIGTARGHRRPGGPRRLARGARGAARPTAPPRQLAARHRTVEAMLAGASFADVASDARRRARPRRRGGRRRRRARLPRRRRVRIRASVASACTSNRSCACARHLAGAPARRRRPRLRAGLRSTRSTTLRPLRPRRVAGPGRRVYFVTSSGTVTQSAPPWSSCTTIQMKFCAGAPARVLGEKKSLLVPLGIESVNAGS